MSLPISQLLAAGFSWTSAGAGLDFTVHTAADHTGTVASGTYRVLLGNGATTGGTTEPLADFLQVVAAALTAAAGVAFSVTMSPTTGLVTIAVASGTFTIPTVGEAMLSALGFASYLTVPAASATATYQPPSCIFLASVTNDGWSPRAPGAYETTADGQTYGYTSGVTSWPVTIACDWIPRNQSVRTGRGDLVTPQQQGPGFNFKSDPLPPSWERVLASGAGGLWAITTVDTPFATIAASTSASNYFALVGLDGKMFTEPGFALRDPSWPAYVKVTLPATQRADVPWSARS